MGRLRTAYALLPCALAALCGCGTTQRVTGLEATPGDEVCIIENGAVRRAFVVAYQQSRTQLGYRPRMLPAGAVSTSWLPSCTRSAHR